MNTRHALASLARRLNIEAGAPAPPALYFFTDPVRTPDPCAALSRLPRGAAVVYRHFGAPDRARVARRLRRACTARGLWLLIAADPNLARRIGADGVHWPEPLLARASRFGLTTASAHSAKAVARVAAFGADACVLGPVFQSASPSAGEPLGLFRASQLARASGTPVIALGGVNTRTARRLIGRGFAGLAAVEALA